MAKVQKASTRGSGKAASGTEKAARQAKKDVTDTSGLALISRNHATAGEARERSVNSDIAELARNYAARAVERIAEIMESDSNREALAAAFHLLDRAYGKPAGLAEDKNDMNEVMLGLREALRAKLARLVE